MRIVLISPYSGIEATGLRIRPPSEAGRLHHADDFSADLAETMAAVNYQVCALPYAVVRRLAELCSDAGLVAMTVMTPSFVAAQLSIHIRRQLAAPILWGGIHPTVCAEECLQYADLVCIGEGTHHRGPCRTAGARQELC